ncbi:MAG: biotin/lipoyl-binding protein [Thermoanaerobaculia bacterium]
MVLGVLLVVAGTAAFVARGPLPVAGAVPPEPTGNGPRVTGNPIRVSDRAVKATGVIRPMIGAEVRVGSRISGVVRRLYVRIGDRVEKGQLLAELDDRDLVTISLPKQM